MSTDDSALRRGDVLCGCADDDFLNVADEELAVRWVGRVLVQVAVMPVSRTNRRRVVFALDDTEQALSFYCLLYTSPSPRDRQKSRMPSSA